MAPIPVHIKHAGKTHNVNLDVEQLPVVFKQSIYELTGVPVDRMKVMIKGGVLKDDTPWKKVAPKEGQTFMVIGTAGELPKPPEKATVFLEDMDESELASSVAMPVGLVNLGNTCYMSASVQALRAIPELQVALQGGPSAGAGPSSTNPRLNPLARALQALYIQMGKTTSSVTPQTFLSMLRQVNPQFAEMARGGDKSMMGMRGYAQQDAEECYAQVLTSLREVPGLPASQEGEAMQVDEGAATPSKSFIEQYMMGEMVRTMTCDEAEEPPTTRAENVMKIECNITSTTNYLMQGLMNSLDQNIEKNSPTLGRQAQYTQRSRLSRLPSYLTVHLVRFAWRADINKKAKIMRRVKFPTELDALELVTDDLKAKMTPVNRRLQELIKDRADRLKQRKRTKARKEREAQALREPNPTPPEQEDASAASGQPSVDEGGELEPESVYRQREGVELNALVDESAKKDTGSNVTGLYELVAIITHKGAAADAGHYIAFVKKSAIHPGSVDNLDDDDEDWYKFDDEKVSVFPKEKLTTLEGGGEDASAYVLLYKAKSLA
ncbi:deubiquitinating enzyme [Pleurotus pulmonarius]|nr:deubiquitinating enzyme [Pleurotus pulmonarius]KAF4588786.1 deubiquitinating enzyme [Pleurotus pulmonarius]